MRRRAVETAGFTLLEVLIATVLLGAISLAAMNFFTSVFRVQHKLTEEFGLRADGNVLFNEISNGFTVGGETYGGMLTASDVRIGTGERTLTMWSGAVSIAYAWDEASGTIEREIRTGQGNVGSSRVVLTNVRTFDIICAGSLVELHLELIGEGQPQPREVMQESIRPRLAIPVCD